MHPVAKTRGWRWFLTVMASVLLLIAVIAWFVYRQKIAPPQLESAQERLRMLCEAKGVPFPPPHRRVVVHKSQRRLLLFSGERLLREYHVALSRSPLGDKEREGDGKVPEGEFTVCDKYPSRSFHLFIAISYPSAEDAERGLRQGIISRREYEAIVRALDEGRCPLWNTALGGAIGLHGGGTQSDWTIGCIALENPDIEELFAVLQKGDAVVIEP